MPIATRWGALLPAPYYEIREIRVIGVPPPEVLLDFERLSASVKPVETVLHGPLRDQAALHGLLARLQASVCRSWRYAVSMIRLRPPRNLPRVRTCPALDTGWRNTTPAGFIPAG